MKVTFIPNERRTHVPDDGDMSVEFPGLKEVTVDLGDGYVLTVKEENGNQNIDMTYPDGQELRLESINK